MIDILLPTYDGAAYVAEAIESVRSQTVDDWQLHVIDDGSTDDTVSIVDSFVADDDRIRLLRTDRLRAVGARAFALQRSGGELVAFIDQDDRWHPAKLARQLDVLDDPDIAAVHTAVRHIDGSGMARPLGAWEENRFRRRTSDAGRTPADVLAVRSAVRLVTAMVRRSALDDIGGLSDDLEGGEDWMLWFHLTSSGYQLAYLDEILVDRRVHGGNTSAVRRLDRRQGLSDALDRMIDAHPEWGDVLATRRAVVDAGTAATLARSRDLDGAWSHLRSAVGSLRQGSTLDAARFGAHTALRWLVPTLARPFRR